MWYITFQFVCYILFFFIGNVKSTIKFGLICILISLLILLLSIFVEVNGVDIYLWGLNSFSFQLGMILTKINGNIKFARKAAFISLVLFSVLFFITYKVLGNPEELIMKNPLKATIALSFALMVFMLTCQYKDKISRIGVLKLIGDYSYYIYLVHAFYIYSLNSIAYCNSLFLGIAQLLLVVVTLSFILKKCDDKILSKLWILVI